MNIQLQPLAQSLASFSRRPSPGQTVYNASMYHRSLIRSAVFIAAFGLVISAFAVVGQDAPQKRGRKYKTPPTTARIEVTVLRDVNGKPIENAAVVFHQMEGNKDTGNMELKTNEDGKAIIDVLPLGYTARLQIIAKGFQTYGEDYKIDKAEMAIEIKMKRPGEQYSIYKNHDGTVVTSKSPDGSKAATAPSEATPAPDASKGKLDNATKPSETQPSQPQPK
jgi:hypothetical protein